MRPTTSAPEKSSSLPLLSGLLLGEALQKFALDDPLVEAARHELARYNRTKNQIAAFDAIFNRGPFRWPVNLPVEELDDLFRPSILHGEEVSWGPRSPKITAAFEHISACFASIVEAARTNKIKVVDIDNKPVHAAVWHRRGIVIDLNTSDLYDGVDGRVLLRRNLYFVDPQLRVAAEASIAHHRDGLPPPPPMPPVYPKSELWKQIEEHVAPAAVAIIEANQTPLRESNTAETEHKNSGGAPLGISPYE